MILKKRKRNSDELYGACLMKINERNYKEKSCKNCNSLFKPTFPSQQCCCSECKTAFAQKKYEETKIINRIKYRAKYKENVVLKPCEICGKPLKTNNQNVHEKCMLNYYLNNYYSCKYDKKYSRYMKNHFYTTDTNKLLDIARKDFKLDIGFKLNKYPTKAVICVETGEVFNSVKDVAQAKYVTSSCIYNAIKYNKTSIGCHWKYV